MRSLSAIPLAAAAVNRTGTHCDISFLFPSIILLKPEVRGVTCRSLYWAVKITSYGC